jgi:hypothetical protein
MGGERSSGEPDPGEAAAQAEQYEKELAEQLEAIRAQERKSQEGDNQ